MIDNLVNSLHLVQTSLLESTGRVYLCTNVSINKIVYNLAKRLINRAESLSYLKLVLS